MSRIGRQPIAVPTGVSAALEAGRFQVRGPKGQLEVSVPQDLRVEIAADQVRVLRSSDRPQHRALHGLTRTLISNAVIGVSQGYTVQLELSGVGYRARLSGSTLELSVGYSHPVNVEPPVGVRFAVPEPTRVDVIGIDKQQVGQVAANLRRVRRPDAYHGKGVHFVGEKLTLKAGKAGAAGAKGGKGKK
jgi:large subunit ribosomal protein L6